MTWLGDNVFSIREAAVKNLSKLTEVFGVEWSTEHCAKGHAPIWTLQLPLPLNCSGQRASPASSTGKTFCATICSLVIRATGDPVPNIRFNVAKTLRSLAQKLDVDDVQSQVRPALTKLSGDDDIDVKYFATEALSVC